MRKHQRLLILITVAVLNISTSNLFAQKHRSNKIDVFLIGGQSNATGQGYLANLSPGIIANKKVLIFHSGKPHLNSGDSAFTWLPLHQASESPDRFGPELGFGNRIQTLLPSSRIAIIKHAHSGTSLYKDWWPGNDQNDSIHFGNQFKIFLETVSKGLVALRLKGYEPNVLGMLWQQGEGDADRTSDIANNYGNNLALFIHRIREQLQLPELLFLYGYVLPPPVIYPYAQEVRKGQFAVSQNSGDSLAVKNAFVIATDDLSHRAQDKNTKYPKDHIHFGTEGIWQLGIRMADKMVEAMKLQ